LLNSSGGELCWATIAELILSAESRFGVEGAMFVGKQGGTA
jgi:hypothetical protein